MEIKESVNHEIKLIRRQNLLISGVNEVESFDDISAVVNTVCGKLTVDGTNLKMSVLDTEKGVVSLDGNIEALSYSDGIKSENQNIFKNIFHKI